MSGDEFRFSCEGEKMPEASAGCACPLSRIPASVWRGLLRPPFRRRHPFTYWLCMLIAFLAAFSAGRWFFSGGELMEGGERLALVTISGPILDAGPILAWIGEIGNNPAVKGALLRVDSPGGGAAASQEIYAALARLAQKMPLAVSMGATAASGGLMASMAGERVFANPSTVTGSIGVRMDIPQLQELMGKIGIGQETLVTAPYKNAASYTQPLTAKDREYLQTVLDDMHRQFVEIVAKGRRMPLKKALALANGKIFTGREALELGLVDALGGQDDAVAWLSQKTGVPAARKLLSRPARRKRVLESLLGLGEMLGIDPGVWGELEHFYRLGAPAFLYQL